MSKNKHQKVMRVINRDGIGCWLCRQPVDLTAGRNSDATATLDHVVPRKWGGKNHIDNLRLAHKACNAGREKLFPSSFVFRPDEIVRMTNPNTVTGTLSRKALKAIRNQSRPNEIFEPVLYDALAETNS